MVKYSSSGLKFISFSAIVIDSVFRPGKRYRPLILLAEFKYKIKRKR